jgi:hypothetical protein
MAWNLGGSVARAWVAGVGVLVGGLATDDPTGLSALLLVLVLFTVYFAVSTVERARTYGGMGAGHR